MPHLQELVKLYKDQPFAVIGINYNDPPEKYRAGLEKFNVTWISAYQGQSSPISKLYQVTGYPTYFLIDETGKLVQTSHSSKDFDKSIARLLEKLGEKDAE